MCDSRVQHLKKNATANGRYSSNARNIIFIGKLMLLFSAQ